MTLEEVGEMKLKMEEKIIDMIHEYESKTNLSVDCIDIERLTLQNMSGEKIDRITVNMIVKL